MIKLYCDLCELELSKGELVRQCELYYWTSNGQQYLIRWPDLCQACQQRTNHALMELQEEVRSEHATRA